MKLRNQESISIPSSVGTEEQHKVTQVLLNESLIQSKTTLMDYGSILGTAGSVSLSSPREISTSKSLTPETRLKMSKDSSGLFADEACSELEEIMAIEST